MGRVAVTAACAGFFGGGSVVGLNTVYGGEPRTVPETAYMTGGVPGAQSGAVGWPYIEAQHDRRIGFAGSSSHAKLVIYEVAFSLRFISYRAKGEDAQSDHDATVDNFTARLRADRTLGALVWQAGEGPPGAEDIHVVTGPGSKQRKNTGLIMIWSMVRFIAIEAL